MTVKKRLKPSVWISYASNMMFLILWGTLAQASEVTSQLYPKAQKVLNQRCIACHSCYGSPCQINLNSYEGIMRGGLADPIYDGMRLTPQDPTRLFIDADTPEEWQKKHNFFPIVNPKLKTSSLLTQSTELGRSRGLNYRNYQFDAKNNLQCPKQDAWSAFAKDHVKRGMPFGFPALTTAEQSALTSWANAGFPGESHADQTLIQGMDQKLQKTIRDWEAWLGGVAIKQRIVSRYLYEHWFLAHIHFENHDDKFFRIVRSSTPWPQEIKEIASVRPFDDPKVERLYYRFRPVRGEIMHKNHIVFELSEENKSFYNRHLLHGNWVFEPKSFPSYEPDKAANPLLTFKDMPLEGRYRFLLRNALYFTQSYIRGPVCEGQVAVNVIRDHFMIAFVDPDSDISIQDPNFLISANSYLSLPASGQSSPFESYYAAYNEKQRKYAKFRADQFRKKHLALTPNSLWDGDGFDRDALLTVFRHFDNSSVLRGAWGGSPRTVWVMDYPIFERMYYLLVAGFNVFDNVFHQSATRLYMDNLRVESENNFLYLLPESVREKVRAHWYEGKDAWETIQEDHPLHSASYRYQSLLEPTATAHPRKIVEVSWSKILQSRLSAVAPKEDPFHCCVLNARKKTPRNELETAMQAFTSHQQGFAQHLPEAMLISLYNESGKDTILFANKLSSHSNMAFMFNEKERRQPEYDRVIVTKDWVGSYPNLIFHGSPKTFTNMVMELRTATEKLDVYNILGKYWLTRDTPNFWVIFDRIHHSLKSKFPLVYGRLDLSKYENIYKVPKQLGSIKSASNTLDSSIRPTDK
ncbi:fatty acid cis/trans isomerase [Pseudobacteriovorax antillogorgiicola]|uniref:Fatty acid cis/trans isomerase (CTI) n=1 Tax=Pseudobacteriovorax antillogorgiicola TaxID=1513793 RepID=A0A1Y6BGC3_9BACT|nr:fatty acid cis/trans isomerase [Pseudobacteriovorax antillogorgiicola]TCS57368.1 fatty acid cis/trans isomerase CTI [Pseudobacteriovorax antillogorgiicola]SMF01936.1 Fatty acid cis/trans isomerase (CTI) [Pseudobacteriovorax antillogorgiicola]